MLNMLTWKKADLSPPTQRRPSETFLPLRVSSCYVPARSAEPQLSQLATQENIRFRVASRLALGLAVSRISTPYVGIPTTAVALYGNTFQAADQNIEGLVVGLTIGEVCNQQFDGQQ